MDINEKAVDKLIFTIDTDTEKKQEHKEKRIFRLTYKNLKRMALEKLKGNMGEC